jgi:hypothetical protein
LVDVWLDPANPNSLGLNELLVPAGDDLVDNDNGQLLVA